MRDYSIKKLYDERSESINELLFDLERLKTGQAKFDKLYDYCFKWIIRSDDQKKYKRN